MFATQIFLFFFYSTFPKYSGKLEPNFIANILWGIPWVWLPLFAEGCFWYWGWCQHRTLCNCFKNQTFITITMWIVRKVSVEIETVEKNVKNSLLLLVKKKRRISVRGLEKLFLAASWKGRGWREEILTKKRTSKYCKWPKSVKGKKNWLMWVNTSSVIYIIFTCCRCAVIWFILTKIMSSCRHPVTMSELLRAMNSCKDVFQRHAGKEGDSKTLTKKELSDLLHEQFGIVSVG